MQGELPLEPDLMVRAQTEALGPSLVTALAAEIVAAEVAFVGPQVG